MVLQLSYPRTFLRIVGNTFGKSIRVAHGSKLEGGRELVNQLPCWFFCSLVGWQFWVVVELSLASGYIDVRVLERSVLRDQ